VDWKTFYFQIRGVQNTDALCYVCIQTEATPKRTSRCRSSDDEHCMNTEQEALSDLGEIISHTDGATNQRMKLIF